MPGTLFNLIQSIKKGCTRTEEQICADHNLSYGELTALRILGHQERIVAGEFADRIHLSPSRGSRVINQMVQKKLIRAEPIPNNRRSIHVSLTSSGKRLKDQIEQEIKHCEEQLLSRLPVEHHDLLISMLQKLSFMLNTDIS
ncbi:MarR family transcriptional regulator [bacterium]|nr:MarR family transcriptional regulator [bacterium]